MLHKFAGLQHTAAGRRFPEVNDKLAAASDGVKHGDTAA
jgi:hypothetical protein